VRVSIAKPFIGQEEMDAVAQVLVSGQLAQGPAVAEFERRFAEYHGASHGIAVSNGTAALTAALMAHDIGRGDEVIVPSFTFFATASSVLSVGARPVFADIDPQTFCLDPTSVEEKITEKTRGVMPVHLYGQLADMPAFTQLCDAHNLVLLEDAAQAHGASIGNRRAGTWGTAAFSFYPSKNMTTTEGGMVLTNDAEIARRLRMIRHQGMNQQYQHERIGYNLRMTDLCAAIGLVQLGRLPNWTKQRIANASFYDANLRGVITPFVREGSTHVYHQYTVRLKNGSRRDELCARLNERGVEVRVYYPTPIHLQPVFLRMPGYQNLGLDQTVEATKSVLSLPVHPFLTDAERQFVIDEANDAVQVANCWPESAVG
jgi:perosamine synthetase